jgi:carboxymethylenebutenolidase
MKVTSTDRSLTIASATRRDFLMWAAAAGLTTGALPAFAVEIVTDTNGLTAGDVKIAVDGFELPSYRAMPETGGPFPTILVVHDVFGVTDHLKDICRRLAKLGYLAIMPDIFARKIDVSALGVPVVMRQSTIITKVLPQLSDAQMLADCEAAVAWIQNTEKKGDPARVAVCGFGSGGRIAWLDIAQSDKYKAAAIWWGTVHTQKGPMRSKQPLDVVPDLKAPVLALFAGQSERVPAELIQSLKDALEKASKTAEVVTYGGARPWFLDDSMPFYRKDDAEDGWKRMLAWFKRFGVA